MRITAVIGANYGDEGKGRLVDQLTSDCIGSVIVVRYNGGAQAGHTVVCPDGKKHSFSHFGSGSFLGATTYLSNFFIANPYLYIKEIKTLQDMGIEPAVFAHPYMPLSTLYDMILNREIEIWRGDNRHGSCGYGIAETVERLCSGRHKTFFTNAVHNKKAYENTIKRIRDSYVKDRLKAYDIKIPTDSFTKSCTSKDLWELYFRSLKAMEQNVKIRRTKFLKDFDNVIFEGSQGLGLDERHRNYPHVTRSRPGLDNIEVMCSKIGINEIDVVYVTRAYLTRHGAGPLQTENEYLFYKDESNVENEWQGRLRFGFLDIDMLTENIRTDAGRTKLNLNRTIAITCFDQVKKRMKIKVGGNVVEIDRDKLPMAIKDRIDVSEILISESPQRKEEVLLQTKER